MLVFGCIELASLNTLDRRKGCSSVLLDPLILGKSTPFVSLKVRHAPCMLLAICSETVEMTDIPFEPSVEEVDLLLVI